MMQTAQEEDFWGKSMGVESVENNVMADEDKVVFFGMVYRRQSQAEAAG